MEPVMEPELERVLRKFANHRESCGCFICRTLTDAERQLLVDTGVLRPRLGS